MADDSNSSNANQDDDSGLVGRPYVTYDEVMARDKVNLDIFWLRDESLEDSANLPNSDVLALEILEDLKAALSQFESIEEDLSAEE